jgi:hypothetical protein
MLIRSPKYYPELAGVERVLNTAGLLPNNGIAVKNLWRSEQKTTFENWSSKVSTSQLKINLRIDFFRRAKQSMLAHQTIESFNNDPEAVGKNLET